MSPISNKYLETFGASLHIDDHGETGEQKVRVLSFYVNDDDYGETGEQKMRVLSCLC